MTDRIPDSFAPDQSSTTERPRRNLIDDVRGDRDRADAGGATADSPGMPGGTLGTGSAREQDA